MSSPFSLPDSDDVSQRSLSSPMTTSTPPSRTVGRRIIHGLASVKKKLTFACASESDFSPLSGKELEAPPQLQVQEDEAATKGVRALNKSTNHHGASLPRGVASVGCEYEMSTEQPKERLYPASPDNMPSHVGQQRAEESEDGVRFVRSPQKVSPMVGASSSSQERDKAWTPDWANGLPPDFIERLASHLNDSCSEDWESVQNVYNAAAVCRRWRDEIQRACFQRSFPCAQEARGSRGNGRRKVERRKSLVDRMLCHPQQLIERLATEEDIIRCFIVREKQKSPFSCKKYKLKLGEDYFKSGKTLLVAHHQLLATKSAYNIYLSSNKGYVSTKRLGQLHSSPYGTLFELHSASKSKSGSIRRTKSGNIRYSFNMLGGRGPRSVQVNLTDDFSDEGGAGIERKLSQMSIPEASPESESSPDCGNGSPKNARAAAIQKEEEDNAVVLENKLPRWHELLQCWCLDFGGRVKCASVKNFQLVSKDDPEEIILQFGKVDADVFTMDFRPKLLTAQQAFMICLSSFDSKLSCF